jgi:hypothetical protein
MLARRQERLDPPGRRRHEFQLAIDQWTGVQELKPLGAKPREWKAVTQPKRHWFGGVADPHLACRGATRVFFVGRSMIDDQ